MRTPIIDDRDWSALTSGERIKQIEVEGYLVLPDLLDGDTIARLKEEIAQVELTAVDYSVHQKGATNLEFLGGAITELIGHAPTIAFLKTLFGDELIMMSFTGITSDTRLKWSEHCPISSIGNWPGKATSFT